MLDDGDPRRVELMSGRRRSATGDAVGLLDERNGDVCGKRDVLRRDEVARSHPSPGPVTEHERGARVVGRVHVRARQTVGGLDLDDAHSSSA
jgi:hypothetical protein